MKQGDLFAEPQAPRRRASPAPAQREPADVAERRLAVTEFARPILLSAGAGTGKTATLVARVVHWCVGPGWERAARAAADAGATRTPSAQVTEPEDVAVRVLRGVSAITFTEAAAAEMATRVGQALARLQRVTKQRSDDAAGRNASGKDATGRGTSGAGAGDDALPIGLFEDALPSDPSVLFERARALRAALDHLNVSTIHAFCRRLLAAHPLEVGLDPAFEVDATFSRTEVCVRDVLEELLRVAWAEPVDLDLVLLARKGVGPPDIERAVIDLLDKGARADDLANDPLDGATCARLVAELESAFAAFERAAKPLAGAKGNSLLALQALPETRRALDACRGSSLERLSALVRALKEIWKGDKRRAERLKDWSKEANTTDGKLLGSGAEAFVGCAGRLHLALEPFLELDPELFEPARRVVHRVLAKVEAELRRRGVVTFNDLLAHTRALLVEHPEIAARERRRLDLLLVDEFQDTDALQCDIVAAIGLDGRANERPSLFLVGDPKQSIFAWRNADLAAFDAFAERVVAAGGSRLELSANFRSRRAVLDEVERAVGPVMEEKRGVQPPFARLVPGRADADEAAAIEYWVSWPRDPQTGALDTSVGRRGASYAVEAAALARDVRTRRDSAPGKVEWSDFAVIFRSFTEIEPYLEKLRELAVPYEVQSDRKYYQRREVIDATALVRAAIDPHDHLALVTLLRSPMIGVPDVALLPLWEGGFPGKVTRLLRPDAGRLAELAELARAVAKRIPADAIPGLAALAGWEESLVAGLGALAVARQAFHSEPADCWVDTLRSLFLPEVAESARFLGAYRLANLERFFRELLRAMEERAGDVQSIVRTLRANLAREDRSEGSRPSDSGQDAVKILTIHGAKGLEFRHVYLAQAHKLQKDGSFGEETNEFDRRSGAKGPAYLLFGAPSPAWFEAKVQRDDADSAEKVRLLYVALTRARERLVVLGGWATEHKCKPWRQARSFLDLIEHRAGAGAAIAELVARAGRGEYEGFTDPNGVQWKLTAFFGGESAAQRRDAGDARPVATLEEIARESALLAADRETAAVRSARPFHRAASQEAHADGAESRALRRYAEGLATESAAEVSVASLGEGDEAARAAVDDGDEEALVDSPIPSSPAEEQAEEADEHADEPADAGRQRDTKSPLHASRGSREPTSSKKRVAISRAQGASAAQTSDLTASIGRGAAQAAGTAVHRVLELADLARDPAVEIARWKTELEPIVRALAAEEHVADALARAVELLDCIESNGLFARLASLRDAILARELPVLLPIDDDVAGADPQAPVGFVSGAIDLLYRDPATGRIVVADYKTDAVEDDASLRERAAHYRSQGRSYVVAVQEALALPETPRFELWFLRAGRVVE